MKLLSGSNGMSDIQKAWQRLEQWAANNAPAMLEDLAPGATDAEISELETALGLTLPDDYRESLSIHNGETDGWPNKVFADRGAYLSTQRSAAERSGRLQVAADLDTDDLDDPESLIRDGVISVDGPVRPVMFDSTWLPVMECNGDVFWALDFSPAEGGTVGQLIEVDWESCLWRVTAASFSDFLVGYVTELESGAYRLVDGLPTKE